MLGQCKHDELKAHSERHDKAMRKIIKEVMKGQSGSQFVIADVGHLEGLRQLGVHIKRIPEFVLPDKSLPQSYIAAYNAAPNNNPEQIRNKLRPDVMMPDGKTPDGKPRKVWVAEAGYCSDTMYEDKLNEKEVQHKHLQEALLA